jgi:hypothetical protein
MAYSYGITDYSNPLSGTLAGAGVQSGYGAYGAVPTAANPQYTQQQAIQGNLNSMGYIGDLANAYSQATTNAAQIPYTSANPSFMANMAQSGQNALQLSQGQLPQSDLNSLINNAVASKYSRGIVGGPNTNAAILQQVFGGQMAAQQQGLSQLSTLAGITPKGAQLDPSSMMVTPSQQLQQQDYANQLSAAPNPTQAAMANLAALQRGMGQGQGAASRSPFDYTSPTQAAQTGGSSRNSGSNPYAPESSYDSSMDNWLAEMGYDANGYPMEGNLTLDSSGNAAMPWDVTGPFNNSNPWASQSFLNQGGGYDDAQEYYGNDW